MGIKLDLLRLFLREMCSDVTQSSRIRSASNVGVDASGVVLIRTLQMLITIMTSLIKLANHS